MRLLLLLFLSFSAAHGALTDSELDSVGRKVWQNECAGTREGLTSWNVGEKFASLGIGHFIWYPKGGPGPFEESFPKLLGYLQAHGAEVPAWLLAQKDCPWANREQFQKEFQGAQMRGLRDLLANTLRLQGRFLAQRMEEALPKMVAQAEGAQRERIRTQFARLLGSGAGTFALIDYVNFKGEGTSASERYHGEGWGLLQVLSQMQGKGDPVADFSQAAAAVLARRVRNAPPERNEGRWLPGWQARVRAYAH